jgi:UDPglucose 6-dehydrogenase
MNISIIGTGYVGLPTGVGLAELGNQVTCIDKDERKISDLRSGKITLFEAGLEDLFHANVEAGKLRFTSSMSEGLKDADLVILAVGTPPHPITKEADMKYIHAAVKELAPFLNGYTVVATKSTVPIGTGEVIEQMVHDTNPNADVDVVSLPEFLREGFAVYDFFHPDRIIVGANTDRARALLTQLYAPFEGKTKMLFVKRRSSEAIKYASNAFLAVKIHYINEMADFCEKAGADVLEVAQGMGLDSRIGNRFLNPGPGFGGSCFPKDTLAIVSMAQQFGVRLSLIDTAIEGNEKRKVSIAKRILNMVEDIDHPTIAVLGLAFKNGTDDCRESPSLQIVKSLINAGVTIQAYDPKAMGTAKQLLGDAITYADSVDAAVTGADVIAILTEWDEFRTLDLPHIRSLVTTPNIFDARNLIPDSSFLDANFHYQTIGR